MAAETGAGSGRVRADGLASDGAGHDLEEQTLAALDDAFVEDAVQVDDGAMPLEGRHGLFDHLGGDPRSAVRSLIVSVKRSWASTGSVGSGSCRRMAATRTWRSSTGMGIDSGETGESLGQQVRQLLAHGRRFTDRLQERAMPEFGALRRSRRMTSGSSRGRSRPGAWW